jgi:cysteine sulfinate desulfinase/cysteine desulfurase-like protein
LGTPHALGRGSLRLTLGHENTPADVEYTIATLAAIVRDLRAHAGTYVPGVLALSGG